MQEKEEEEVTQDKAPEVGKRYRNQHDRNDRFPVRVENVFMELIEWEYPHMCGAD